MPAQPFSMIEKRPDRPPIPPPRAIPAAPVQAAAPDVKPVPASPPPPVAVRRFSFIDLNEMGLWLTKRLGEQYPDTSVPQRLNFLQNCMDSNEYLFVRTSHAVALASLARAPMRAAWVEEVFVLAVKDADDSLAQAAQLYQDIRRWGETMGATEIVVDRFSDVPRDMIRAQIGRVFLREDAFVRLREAAK